VLSLDEYRFSLNRESSAGLDATAAHERAAIKGALVDALARIPSYRVQVLAARLVRFVWRGFCAS
jgi:hypothetical protein